MRRKLPLTAAFGLAATLALTTAARPQDDPFGGLQPHYWPHRQFGIPVNTDAIAKEANKPTHLQLYYSLGRNQPFQKGPKLPLNGLQDIDKGKKGIIFDAPRDGDYEFALQHIYPDTSVSPKTEALGPEIRVVIDTTYPRVQLGAVGNGVEWRATDENLDPNTVSLEAKLSTSAQWTKVKREQPFRAADTYAWKIPQGTSLDVRVIAKDRAGHEGVSPVVRVPPEPGMPVGLPKGGAPGWGGAAPPPPRIDFVKSLEFDVEYTVQRMGRSGVQAAHLFVLKEQGPWALVDRYPVKLMPDDKPPHTLSLKYKADREGTYGFYIIPESGAGKRADDPKKDDPPMVLVVVDTSKPHVKITGVQVKPGGVRGPLVELTWDAADPNLMPQPIDLEWSLDRTAPKWNEIKYRLENNLSPQSGRFAWEVPDEKVWKFYVRARATDKAANVGEHVWDKEVIVDLEKPTATIDKVRGGGGPAPARPTNDSPPVKGKSDAEPAPEVPELPKSPAIPPKKL